MLSDEEKNSIKEDIILLKDFTEGNFKRDKLENYKGSYKMGYFYYKDIQQAIERVLSDYKRVLKEIEELKETLKCTQNSWYEDTQKIEEMKKQIDLDYECEIALNNRIMDLENADKKWEDRIKAINERILELQELIEREK